MTDFDNVQAANEGWVIADCEGSDNGPWQLQKLDHLDVFETDDDAWRHVVEQAIAGSAYHRGALNFLSIHNPQERECIFNSVEAGC